ncbi:MAG: LacI family DNA-binding transcriptional regulator [Armatimonadota bacterium]|nr:LacI family DNA-binding transcriptional regulator [Armatimonadota bacterium]
MEIAENANQVKVKKRKGRRPSGRVTMQTIAARVGVSQATVSYVLNNKAGARVSASIRAEILRIARELNYYPNEAARRLAGVRSRTLGILQLYVRHSVLAGWWSSEVMRGIADTGFTQGYHLMIYAMSEDVREMCLNAVYSGRLEGLIILAPYKDEPLLKELCSADVPVAVVGSHQVFGEKMVAVDADNEMGGYLATKHLIEQGHRRIAHLHGALNIPNACDRLRGYHRAMQEAGLPILPELVRESGFLEQGSYEITRELLQLPEPPTAVFAANDVSAVGVLRAVKDAGLHVPEDVAIIGYDGTPFTQLTEPPLSTVEQPASEMGRVAARLLIEVIDGYTPSERVVKLPVRLAARSSSCSGVS